LRDRAAGFIVGPMRRVRPIAFVAPALVALSCSTTPASLPAPTTGGDTSWLPAARELRAAANLDEAAASLCARDLDAVIDDDVRAAAGVWEGRVVGVMATSRQALIEKSAALFAGQGLTHIGVAEASGSGGRGCVAAVASRRLLDVVSLPRAERLDESVPSVLTVSLSRRREGRVFVLSPDGFVDRIPLEGSDKQQSLTLPFRRPGRHVVEVLVDELDADGQPRGAPEVALLWPYVRGREQLAMPVPEVLFPDEGHDDQALTYRAEALVQRLRNEQLLEPLKVSPALGEVAQLRARAVSSSATLGHRLDGEDPKAALRSRFGDEPRAQFIRLAEVQARGGTLKDAWETLVDSPAHRYELVSMGVTHVGVAVVRGRDALQRDVVNLVMLLGRRPPARDPIAFQKDLLEATNKVRVQRGYDALSVSDTLETTARRLATRMMEVGRVDDQLLGGPVGEVALEADASMTKVHPLVARIDDPLLLGPFSPLLELDTTAMGASFALHPTEGVFYVVVLAGVGG
jgi:uncharacterized protein YkwD